MRQERSTLPEYAYYYGASFWGPDQIDWVKSLLLFFDGIATAAPSEKAKQLIDSDPILAQPLVERGLLRNFTFSELFQESPHFDEAAVHGAIQKAREALDGGDFTVLLKHLAKKDERYASYVKSVSDFFAFVQSQAQEGGRLLYNPPALVGGYTARLLVENIQSVRIQPVVNDERIARYAASVIGPPAQSLRGKLITADMHALSVDLSRVPLDDILGFRATYGSEYRAYARDLRKFVNLMSLASTEDQLTVLNDRAEELRDQAQKLFRDTKKTFGKSVLILGLSLAGVAWTMHSGDPAGALISAGTAAASFAVPDLAANGGAYSYILRAQAEL